MTDRPSDAVPSPDDSARAHAVRQLLRIEEEGAFVGLGNADVPDARTARQTTDYVAGVTRWRRWLDFLLAHYYRGTYDDIEPLLRQILRVGAYDLLLSQTPPHAAVHEAVDLAKRMVRPGAGGLVNGLLRTLQRQREGLPTPGTGDRAEDLAIRYSHPSWMVHRWMKRYGGRDAEALVRHNNRRPTYGVRHHPLRTGRDAFHEALREAGVDFELSPWLDDFVRIERLQPILRAGWLEEGRCAVQDESAGLVVRLLDPQPGETVLDACAAPGGKALYAAARMGDKGRLLAYDVHPGRLKLVAEAAAQHGLDAVVTRPADARTLGDEGEAVADRVLVDAPCSGLGVLAKRADLRWHREAGDLSELTALQDELLDAGAALVRPGGLLVYATCTIEPEENEDRVAAFLERHPSFRLEPAGDFVPAGVQTPDGMLSTFPPRHGTDGAFAARLRRAL